MKNINKKDLCEALLCVEMMEIRKIDENPSVQWKKSANYIDAIEKLLADVRARNNAPSFTFKKAIAAVLIAALILAVTACAVIKPIREFFVEAFDEYIRVEPIIPEIPDNSEETENPDASDDDKDHEDNKDTAESIPKTIETAYTITVPEEFMLIDNSKNEYSIMSAWMDELGSIITYGQDILDEKAEIRVDNGEYSEIVIDNKTVFKLYSKGMYVLMWKEHGYLFTLSCTDTVPWETIVNMIADLAPEENAST